MEIDTHTINNSIRYSNIIIMMMYEWLTYSILLLLLSCAPSMFVPKIVRPAAERYSIVMYQGKRAKNTQKHGNLIMISLY